MAVYSAMIDNIDQNIGRVLEYLDQEELNDQTLVMYMGDNGFALGEHGFYDKRDAFEESLDLRPVHQLRRWYSQFYRAH